MSEKAASPEVDWRTGVTQAQRNSEVMNVATVLASLDPGASSNSKLGMANRFENTMFQAAKSYEDYKKKIGKADYLGRTFKKWRMCFL